MIEITNIQAQILETFIDHHNSTDKAGIGAKARGLSSVGISKKGINKRTFRNNCAFLVNHYLIKIIHEEEHPYSSKKKNNYLNWKYYSLTPFGQLVYWKWNLGQKRDPHYRSKGKLPPTALSFEGKIGKRATGITDRIAAVEKIAREFNPQGFVSVVKDVLDHIDFFPTAVILDPDNEQTITTTSDIEVNYTIPIKTEQELTIKDHYTVTDADFILTKNITKIDPKTKKEVIDSTEDLKYESRLPDDIMNLVEFMLYWNCLYDLPGHMYLATKPSVIKKSKKMDYGSTPPRHMHVLISELEGSVGENWMIDSLKSLLKSYNMHDKVRARLLKNIQNSPRLLELFKKHVKEINKPYKPPTQKIISKFVFTTEELKQQEKEEHEAHDFRPTNS